MPSDILREPPHRGAGLVDVLDRVLDKGLLIAGDIRVALAEVELLTIRIRLIVCSIDKAEQIGLDWWKYDQHLAPGSMARAETERLRVQVEAMEKRIAQLSRSRNGRTTAPLTTTRRSVVRKGPPAGRRVPKR
jgi:Gas vesicle protein